MSGLESIDVKVEPTTGNVLPLLNEIKHALRRLVDSGEATVIDLRSIPLAPGDEERLVDALGDGEVSVEIDALGPSKIVETAVPGTWIVTHYNADEEIVGKYIEVTRAPAILMSQDADICAGIAALDEKLDSN